MKTYVPAIGAIVLALSSFTVIVQSYSLRDGATVTFEMPEEKVKGSIGGLSTEIVFDAENLDASSISGWVEVSLLDTGIKPRNKHLQAEGYFDAENHGQLSFSSTEIAKAEDGYQMKGMLTMKGTSQEVVWDFTFKDNTFMGTTTIFTNDYGVYTKKKREKSRVDITVTAPVE